MLTTVLYCDSLNILGHGRSSPSAISTCRSIPRTDVANVVEIDVQKVKGSKIMFGVILELVVPEDSCIVEAVKVISEQRNFITYSKNRDINYCK